MICSRPERDLTEGRRAQHAIVREARRRHRPLACSSWAPPSQRTRREPAREACASEAAPPRSFDAKLPVDDHNVHHGVFFFFLTPLIWTQITPASESSVGPLTALNRLTFSRKGSQRDHDSLNAKVKKPFTQKRCDPNCDLKTGDICEAFLRFPHASRLLILPRNILFFSFLRWRGSTSFLSSSVVSSRPGEIRWSQPPRFQPARACGWRLSGCRGMIDSIKHSAAAAEAEAAAASLCHSHSLFIHKKSG